MKGFKWMSVAAMALTLQGCALTDWFTRQGDAAVDLLVLRATYQVPAQQAGVLELAEQQANRLDAALSSGSVEDVRAVLLSMQPVYLDVMGRVTDPTPEQKDFHKRAISLWEYVEQGTGDRLRELALIVLTEFARRVP